MINKDRTAGSRRAGEASQELAHRSSATSIAHLILLTVLSSATLLTAHRPQIVAAAGIAGLIAGGVRLALSWHIAAQENYEPDISWTALRTSTYACAAAWAILCCAAAASSVHGRIFLLVFTATLLIAAGEAVALGSDLAVARSYLMVLLAPIILWEVITGAETGYFGAAAASIGLVYSLWQAQQQWSWLAGAARARDTFNADMETLQSSIAGLEALKTQAEQAARTKAELLATMSHTIRTPLNDVILVAELLSGTELTSEQRDFVQTVHVSGDTLLAGINDILDFTTIEAGKLTLHAAEFDLRPLVEKTAAMVDGHARLKGSAVTCQIDPHAPASFIGDPARLHQILHHFLSNAVDGASPGQRLLLRIDPVDVYGASVTLRFSAVHASDKPPSDPPADGALPVDSAPLPPSSAQPDSPAPPRQGTAELAHVICERLLELMGGSTVAERGAVFCFTLPMRISPRSGEEPAPDLRQSRILVVDDNATTRKLLQSQLARLDVNAECVDSGSAALAALAGAVDERKPYHAVLVDDLMPRMDGPQLASAVREQPALDDVALILLHSQSIPLADEGLHAAGFADCVQKPVNIEELRRSLIATLRKVPALRPSLKPAPEPSQVRGRLLLADDNPMNQKVALRVLEKLGYYVDTVGNGSDAVEKLQKGLYDAVLMDCQMPIMDGYEATREIRRREGSTRHTVIIAITASAMSGDRKRCLEAGMDDYVTKPVRSTELQQMLARHLTRPVPLPSKVVAHGRRIAAGELGDRLWELEQDVGSAAMDDLIGEWISETARYVARLQEAMRRGDAQTALEALEALSDCSANVAASHLRELCSQLANQRNPVKDYATALSALVDAHQTLTRELEELYPACRMKTW